MRKILLVAVVIVLLALPATTVGAQRFAPLNYCTTVSAVQEQGLTTYAVNATGSGRWARIVEYPVASPAVVIAVQDFGAGATSYFFQHVALSPSHQYQVQTSHTSATTGFSTSGCVFAPAPLNVIVEDFRASCAQNTVTLEWSVASHIEITHFVIAKDGDEMTRVQATCPGCTTGASYMRYLFLGDPTGIYTLITWNGDVISDVSEYQLTACQVPTAVRLSRFIAR